VDSYKTVLENLGHRAKALRISQNLQQSELATRAGLGVGTVTRFERTGKASIENVLRIATVLRAEGAFDELFAPAKYRTLDEALAVPATRKRVRRRR
jgi:transcriptional regulator with XRE-family HTH domain